MNLHDYNAAAARFRRQSTHQEMVLNAAFGLADEIFELLDILGDGSHAVIQDEAGDVLFYLAWLMHELDIPWPGVNARRVVVGPDAWLIKHAGTLTGAVKKWRWHGAALNHERVAYAAQGLVIALNEIAVRAGASLPTIAQANIDKLTARWPGGFPQEGVQGC